MAFLFNRSRQRQPAEVARTTKDLLVKLRDGPGDAKVREREKEIASLLTDGYVQMEC